MVNSPDSTIRVLIAVEDPILAIGLRAVVDRAEDCAVVGAVSGAADVRGATADLAPDVILLDVGFRRQDPALVPTITRDGETRVLVLVDHSVEECALRHLLADRRVGVSQEALNLLDDCCLVSLRESASGCVPKGSEPDRLLHAIRAVRAGEIAAAPWLAAVLGGDRGRRRPGQPSGPRPISARELEVIALVAEGLANQDIAARLGIREQTVKNHLGRIMKKLGLGSRLEIGLFAARHHVQVRQPPSSRQPGKRHAP